MLCCSVGVNVDAAEVTAARARGVANVVRGDAACLPLEDGAADAVVAVEGGREIGASAIGHAVEGGAGHCPGLFSFSPSIEPEGFHLLSFYVCLYVCICICVPLSLTHSLPLSVILKKG